MKIQKSKHGGKIRTMIKIYVISKIQKNTMKKSECLMKLNQTGFSSPFKAINFNKTFTDTLHA